MKMVLIIAVLALASPTGMADPDTGSFKSIFKLTGGARNQPLPAGWIDKIMRLRKMRADSTPAERTQGDALVLAQVRLRVESQDLIGYCTKILSKKINEYPRKLKEHEAELRKPMANFSAEDLAAQLRTLRQAHDRLLFGEKDETSTLGVKIAQYNQFVRSLSEADRSESFGGERIVRDGKTARQIRAKLNEEVLSALRKSITLLDAQSLDIAEDNSKPALSEVSVCTARQGGKICSRAGLFGGATEQGTTLPEAFGLGIDPGKAYFPSLENYLTSSDVEPCLTVDALYGGNSIPGPAQFDQKGGRAKGSSEPNSNASRVHKSDASASPAR